MKIDHCPTRVHNAIGHLTMHWIAAGQIDCSVTKRSILNEGMEIDCRQRLRAGRWVKLWDTVDLVWYTTRITSAWSDEPKIDLHRNGEPLRVHRVLFMGT